MQALRRALLAAAAGLALADAAIVTLALPELIFELGTTVEGVAAVIGVYTLVLALAPLGVEPLARRVGHRRLAAGGFALFALASVACAVADSLTSLLVARALQALGGAAGLVAGFPLLRGGEPEGRRWWVAAAVLATAVGPALGGALTEAFDWRAIFVVQAPIAAVAVAAALASPAPAVVPTSRWGREHVRPAIGLALLVAGFATDPLTAAAVVTVTPVAAVLGALVPGDARVRAAAGAALVGGGTLALAWLPGDRLLWTVPAQALAGAGLGLSLTAIAGPLLPERTPGDAARLLAARHLGITLALVAVAPLLSNGLDSATDRALPRAVGLVLDAPLSPLEKLQLIPDFLPLANAERPRAALQEATASAAQRFSGEERATFDRVAQRVDDVVVRAVGEAAEDAFLVTGGLALLAALVLVPLGVRGRALVPAAAAVVLAVAAPVVYARAERDLTPPPVRLQDPCVERDLPGTGGATGAIQDEVLRRLDQAACDAGATREELALALLDERWAERYEQRYGEDPSSLGGILRLLLGG